MNRIMKYAAAALAAATAVSTLGGCRTVREKGTRGYSCVSIWRYKYHAG